MARFYAWGWGQPFSRLPKLHWKMQNLISSVHRTLADNIVVEQSQWPTKGTDIIYSTPVTQHTSFNWRPAVSYIGHPQGLNCWEKQVSPPGYTELIIHPLLFISWLQAASCINSQFVSCLLFYVLSLRLSLHFIWINTTQVCFGIMDKKTWFTKLANRMTVWVICTWMMLPIFSAIILFFKFKTKQLKLPTLAISTKNKICLMAIKTVLVKCVMWLPAFDDVNTTVDKPPYPTV